MRDLGAHLSFDDYEEVFIPGAPLELPDFFFGREQQLRDLERALRRPGLHPTIIGNRGVGKTSLAHQAFLRDDLVHIKITCNPHMTFDQFAKIVLRRLGHDVDEVERSSDTSRSFDVNARPFGVGVEGSRSQGRESKSRGIGDTTLGPWQLFEHLKPHEKTIIILDEFDTISRDNASFHRGIVSLIKTLADNRRDCESRVLLIGVAQAALDLLAEHESIERSVREIHLRPLRYQDIRDFLSEAERELQFSFAPAVSEALVTNSLGYPYYVHLVGLECLDCMRDRDPDARTVTVDDYEAGVRNAVKKAFRTELRKYKKGIQGLGKREMEVIKALVNSQWSDRVPRRVLQRTLKENGVMQEEEFSNVLLTLQQEKGLLYVSRSLDDVRFSDPLMAPFLRTWILPVHERQRDMHQLQLRFDEE